MSNPVSESSLSLTDVTQAEMGTNDISNYPIRVLAVRQPWASLIIEGLKTIEVRSQPTNIRETVAIYASNGTYTETEKSDLICEFLYLADNKIITYDTENFAAEAVFHQPKGYIIGTVELYYSSAIPVCDSDSFGFYSKEHLTPISYYKKGKTFFWGLRNPIKFSSTISYKPPKGAVVWSKTVLPEGYK